MTLTTAITTRYADPALEKNSAGLGRSNVYGGRTAISAVFFRPKHGKSSMGESCGKPSGLPGSVHRSTNLHGSPTLLVGGEWKFKPLVRRHIMSNSFCASAQRPQFSSVISEQQIISIDKTHSNLGVSRRLALLILSKNSDQLIASFGKTFADDGGETLTETIESLTDYRDKAESLFQIVDSACARLLLVAEFIVKENEQ